VTNRSQACSSFLLTRYSKLDDVIALDLFDFIHSAQVKFDNNDQQGREHLPDGQYSWPSTACQLSPETVRSAPSAVGAQAFWPSSLATQPDSRSVGSRGGTGEGIRLIASTLRPASTFMCDGRQIRTGVLNLSAGVYLLDLPTGVHHCRTG
jgi:hypothetical protein